MFLKLIICGLLFACSLVWCKYHCPKAWEAMEWHDWFLFVTPIWLAFLFGGCF